VIRRPLSLLVALFVVAQATASPISNPATRLVATALIMGGTGQPMVIPHDTSEFISSVVDEVTNRFVIPSGLCTGGSAGCNPIAVFTPEELAPLLGDLHFGQSVAVGRQLLDDCIRGAACAATVPPFTVTTAHFLADTSYVVLGESQSAVISSDEKSHLIARPVPGKTISFILLSNEKRPNGGVLARFVGAYLSILDIEFNGAAPTNSSPSAPLTTVDIAYQYDGWADFPLNPLNLLADFNALMGMIFLHPAMHRFVGVRELQGQYQDTSYYLQPADLLPMLIPVRQIPVVGPAVAVALDAPLRVLVEAGYDRTINPGEPTPANFSYAPNPINTLANFVVAIPTGWDDAISYVTGDSAGRPFHTAPQPIYGVGGSSVYRGAVDPYGPPTPATPITSVSSAVTGVNTAASSRQGQVRRIVGSKPYPISANAGQVRYLPALNEKSLSSPASVERPLKSVARPARQSDQCPNPPRTAR